MCLAIPGKVVETFAANQMATARVQSGGVIREACLEYVPETQVGEYVLVQVGFAISRVDEQEARRTYAALEELDQLTELDAPVVEEVERLRRIRAGVEVADEISRRIPRRCSGKKAGG